jgi:DNA topoisomerase VI subunit B
MSVATMRLERTTFQTSRLMEFFTERELVAQTGHQRSAWPEMIVKELVDNALDACESAGIPPEITIAIDENSISVTDNGPGLPLSTVRAATDFATRTSSNARYISPTRGSQGNALKTVLAVPTC